MTVSVPYGYSMFVRAFVVSAARGIWLISELVVHARSSLEGNVALATLVACPVRSGTRTRRRNERKGAESPVITAFTSAIAHRDVDTLFAICRGREPMGNSVSSRIMHRDTSILNADRSAASERKLTRIHGHVRILVEA